MLLGATAWIAGNWDYKPRQKAISYLEIAPSIPAQLLTAFGDRYLAANIGVWRSVVVGGDALPDYALQTLRRIQVDAAWMNPAHEDNYYTANAVLPWEGFVGEAQYILEAAVRSRRDVTPAFFLAFNDYYFLGDVDRAVQSLNIAADMAEDAGARDFFLGLASRWKQQGDDVAASIRIIKKVMGGARNKRVAQQVGLRLRRLEGLGVLRTASAEYVRRHDAAPPTLQALVDEGYLSEIPVDPTGIGYSMINGRVVLRSRETSYRILREGNR